MLAELRKLRQAIRIGRKQELDPAKLTFGQRVADRVAATMGSWTFIIVQSVILLAWVSLNVVGYVKAWDPYPFILLNLALSFQAAYAAPIIMMSQNRQQDIDRQAAENDYKVNIKAELEIELLHHKLDQLREQEVLYLTKAVRELTELLNRSGICAPPELAGEQADTSSETGGAQSEDWKSFRGSLWKPTRPAKRVFTA
ncbi:DUF1003 domain-containing protein [Sphingomonas sp.]|uniref:DUF1003 domain-containing protein n=1 Tax=Sphingomonas sp. TaxID=28214 RepID=UPI0025D68D93|nr:DUF1003 domain-containing protein [Sphingomonas sp.]